MPRTTNPNDSRAALIRDLVDLPRSADPKIAAIQERAFDLLADEALPEEVRKRGGVLTATEVAQLVSCDLKTLHNYANAGRIEHFRTPGRHLRFQPGAVVVFLKAWGYEVPAWLRDMAPVATPEAPVAMRAAS